MKRAGQLMEAIADPDNLRLAFWKAAKGKRAKADCAAFQARLDAHLLQIRDDLLGERITVGDYHYFQIRDPKERTICAASFRERVLHHALMNVCEPILERAAIFDSYACRRGKGRLAAIDRAQGFARRHGWFLKLDIRKYFDSVDHSVLEALLAKKIKDPAVLRLFSRIIDSYETGTERGLPIGNLTSQHFANFFLAPLDRYIKEVLRRKAYARYMDDFVVWADYPAELTRVRDQIREFLATALKLEVKPNTALNRTIFGMDFLGNRIFPLRLRLARRSKVRFARKLRRYEAAFADGRWTELELQQRVQALVAFVQSVDCLAYRRHVMERFGVIARGLEPRDPRWQLEQQRQELPVRQPQQQHAGQPEQQYRLPRRPGLSSPPASDGAAADPAVIPSTP